MKIVLSILLVAVLTAMCLFALSVSAAAGTQQNSRGIDASCAAIHADAASTRLLADAGEVISTVPADNIDSDGSIKNTDGINTKAVGIWIGVISGVLFCAILTCTIILAKKNRGK